MCEYIKRFNKIKRGLVKIRQTSRSNIVYKDDLDHYFLDCFSLKEYIKNDEAVHRKAKQSVEAYLNKNIYLRLSADLANRDKHLALKTKREGGEITGSSFDIQAQHVITASATDLSITFKAYKNGELEVNNNGKDKKLIMSKNNPSNSNAVLLNQRYVVTNDDGKIYDALYLAEACYKAWFEFLKQHNIIESI